MLTHEATIAPSSLASFCLAPSFFSLFSVFSDFLILWLCPPLWKLAEEICMHVLWNVHIWNVCISLSLVNKGLKRTEVVLHPLSMNFKFSYGILVSQFHSWIWSFEFSAVILSNIIRSFIYPLNKLYRSIPWGSTFYNFTTEIKMSILCLTSRFICWLNCLDLRWNILLMVEFQVLDLGTKAMVLTLSSGISISLPHLISGKP